jgi:tetratricopeptide (TPR) repeat protein
VNPNLTELHLAYSLFHSLMGNSPAAIASAQKAVESLPNDYNCHYWLGVMLARAGRWQHAGDAFARSLELKPDFAEPYRWKALIAHWSGDQKWAERHMQRAISLDPDGAHILMWAAGIKLNRGEFRTADSLLARAMELSPKTPAFMGARGMVHVFMRDLQSATGYLKDALTQANSTDFNWWLGWSYRLQSDDSRAKKAFEETVKLGRQTVTNDPSDMESELFVLAARCLLGDINDPAAELQRLGESTVLVSNPATRPLGVATVYASVKDRDKTIEALRTLLALKIYAPSYVAAAPQFEFLRDDAQFRELDALK